LPAGNPDIAVAAPAVSANAVNGRFAISLREGIAFALLLLGIHLTLGSGYLLFHSLVELSSVCIAVVISVIALNCWHLIRNQYLLVLGAAYFFVGLLDVLHTLSYKGMPIFTDYDYYAPQFWIAARYLESLSMLAGCLLVGSRRHIGPARTTGVFAAIAAASIASILHFRNFPVCFVAGQGLTVFKVVSEYAICGIVLTSMIVLHRRRRLFDPAVYGLIQWAALLTVVSELCFTLYTSDAMSDSFNELGHLFKAARFFLIYKALVVTGLRDPLALLFRDLKRGEESLLEAQQLAQLGSWEWDLETGEWNWTAEISHLFGIRTDAQPRLESLLRTLPEKERTALVTALHSGEPFELLLTIGGEGSERYAQMRGRPMRDELGKVSCLVGTILDVSKQQRLMNALTQAKEAADAASVAKSAFLSNMSHEIRTPLNAVLGFARIGARDAKDDGSRTNFNRIVDAGVHLVGVINGILDYAKIEAGKFAVESRPFQPAAVVANARSFVMELAQHKGLDCMVEGGENLPEWLAGDALRLQQILVNLLANAVKFTAEGYVCLRISREGDETRFRVEDSGIGMAAEDIARLFKPFEQADNSASRSFGGTGLGLAISQSLAHLMGGVITVESRLRQGSVFTLTLPLPIAAPLAKGTRPSADAQSLAGCRVLAAEDVDVNRLILEDLLIDAGASVTFAHNGQEAVDQIDLNPGAFDVVLMDVQMPIMDGYEATRRIKERAPELPVIGLTAHALAEERMKCFAAGMFDHITKPVEPQDLADAVLRALGRNIPGDDVDCVPAKAQATASDGGEVDWEGLRTQMGGKPGLLLRLAQMAVSAHGDKPARLRAAAAARNYRELAELGHALRGVAGNLKAAGIMELARQVEEAAKREADPACHLADPLAAALERMLAELAAHAESAELPGSTAGATAFKEG
jgi:signal transduction histidine kinase/CheY-like chemotaxis protein